MDKDTGSYFSFTWALMIALYIRIMNESGFFTGSEAIVTGMFIGFFLGMGIYLLYFTPKMKNNQSTSKRKLNKKSQKK